MGNFRPLGCGVLSAIAALTASIPAYAAESEQTLSLESGHLQSMTIFAGEGFLHIQGIDSGEQIEVVAKIVGGRGRHRLTLREDGNTAVLVAANADRHFVWFGERPHMDVTVKVPSRLLLEVRDGPGDIALTNMKAAATVIDDSGDLSVKHHHGDLTIYDGAGGIKIEDITGKIYILDGAGDLSVEKVVGNVAINDGIGSIVMKSIDGHASIHDGRGGVAVADITRGFTLNDGRSGQLAIALAEERD